MHDGQHVAVFGVPTSTGNLTEDAPRVQVVDVGAGALAADVPLAGLKAGQFEVGPGDRLEYPYRMYRPALAWDLARSHVHRGFTGCWRIWCRRLRRNPFRRRSAGRCSALTGRACT